MGERLHHNCTCFSFGLAAFTLTDPLAALDKCQSADLVDRIRRYGFGQSASPIADGPEEGACRLQRAPIGLEVAQDQATGCRVKWHISRLAAFARHL